MGDSTDKCGMKIWNINGLITLLEVTDHKRLKIEIPSSVMVIGESAFLYCYDLEEVEIPNSVRKICRNAFSCSRRLKKIKIPSSVKVIEEGAFYNCIGLEEITVDENDRWYDSREGCNAIIDSETNELISGCKNTVIPASVTKIADKAFEEVGLDDDYLYDVYKKYGNQSAMSYYRNKI